MTFMEPGKPTNRLTGAAASGGGADQSRRRRRKIEISGDSDWLARRSTRFLSFQPQPGEVNVFVGELKYGRCKVSPGMWPCVWL